MSRHIIGIRPGVFRLGMLAVVEVTGIDGVTTKTTKTVVVDAADRPDLVTAMEVLRAVYKQLSDAALAAYDDPPRVCECGESTREDECPRCGATIRAEEAPHAGQHPDGCHTMAPGFRDCESDGHYSCATCSRRVEREGER